MEIAILQDIKSITLAATGSTTKRQHTTTNIRLKAMGIAVQYLLCIYIYIHNGDLASGALCGILRCVRRIRNATGH